MIYVRNKKCGNGKIALAIAFGLGMIVAFFCPSGFIVAILVIALILLGLFSLRF